jgi:alpha-tubulin suppressor-like RCC1 family protein
VSGVPALAAIGAAISRFTCGLAAAGEAWCWGFGLGGQLGDGLRSSSDVPVAVAGGGRFGLLRTSALGDATCVLSTTGEPWCWGPGGGLFGDPAVPALAPVPVAVNWGHAFATFDLGEQHGCGLTSSGEAWCWGGNWYGQLGEGTAGGAGGLARAASPVAVTGNHRFSQIAAGSDHTCALDALGAASCWGAWDGLYAPAPAPVPGGHAFVSLAAGFLHTCGLTATGEAWCWGPNDVGQLGDGTGRASFVPVRVAVGVPLARLSHRPTCALTAAGQAWCWGNDLYGQVGRASPFQR